MKILQVSHGFPPNENAGVEIYTFYLAQALTQENLEVHVFCREEDPEREEFSTSEEEIDGLKITRVVNNLTRIPDPQTYYDNHFFDQAFLEVLKKVKPDVVHFQHIIALSANLMKIAKAEGCPVVLTLHDFFLLCHRVHLLKREDRLCAGPRYGLECVSCLDYMYVYKPQDLRTRFSLRIKDTLPFPILKWAKRFLIPLKYLDQRGYEVFHRYRFIYEAFKSPDVILTPSHFVRNLFLKYYPVLRPKTLILPLGIPPIRDQKQAKKRVEGIRFCYIGNILPIKGLHILVDAFRSLPKGKATLTIYGSANPGTQAYCDRLKEKSSGLPVDFPGSFRREDLGEVLNNQDVVVLPSICYESFSLVLREANSLGLPVIASRIGAIPEAVKEGGNGFLFEPGNAEDLRRCMSRFIEQPHLIETMARKMPKIKSMKEHAGEIAGIYDRLLRTGMTRSR